jgi:hypothetical protein
MKYRINPKGISLNRPEFIVPAVPGSVVDMSECPPDEVRRLLKEAIIVDLSHEGPVVEAKGARAKTTQVTRFNLDPEGLQDMELDELGALLVERNYPVEFIPEDKEKCIRLLSVDFLGGEG